MAIIRADARNIPLADGSVQCCISSPPYWGLRDYGTARWDGGDAECDHASAKIKTRADYPFSEASRKQTTSQGTMLHAYRSDCPCGARRVDAQIGLEPTPEAYVATMVQVFREVRRVLRDDGTLWLNLGDSYASAPAGNYSQTDFAASKGARFRMDNYRKDLAKDFTGLKPKDLCGMPWLVAKALQAPYYIGKVKRESIGRGSPVGWMAKAQSRSSSVTAAKAEHRRTM